MFNICHRCGLYRPDKVIDAGGPFAICPECGHPHRFHQLPLLIVSGPSGAGKSTICQRLLGTLPQAVLLDADILWRAEFSKPATGGAPGFIETWLRLAKNIHQSGRPVVLFGAGFGVPDPIEACVERRYLGPIHYLALVCSDQALAARLHERPEWRQTHTPEFIEGQRRFNQWFKDRDPALAPAVELLDTTDVPVEATERQVVDWIARHTLPPGVKSPGIAARPES